MPWQVFVSATQLLAVPLQVLTQPMWLQVGNCSQLEALNADGKDDNQPDQPLATAYSMKQHTVLLVGVAWALAAVRNFRTAKLAIT
jgi:hypothetical protein